MKITVTGVGRQLTFFSGWPLKLWDFKKHYQYLGEHGAYVDWYMGSGGTLGAALANRKYGRHDGEHSVRRGFELCAGSAVDWRPITASPC